MSDRHASVEDAPALLPGAVEAAERDGDRLVIERDGQAVAVLVSASDLDYFERLEDEADVAAMRAARAEGGETIPWEDAKRMLEAEHGPA